MKILILLTASFALFSTQTAKKAEVELPPVSRDSIPVLNKHALKLVKPRYPAIARKAHASGIVVVKVLVDEKGEVISARAVSGHPLLLAVSVEAARKSLFSPTLIDDVPVKVTGLIQYNFIEGGGGKVDEAPDGAKVPEAVKHDENVADVCVQDCPEKPSYSTGILNGRALKLAKPSYPAAAREAGASGLVVVRVLIDEKGKVIAAHAVSGDPLLHDVSVEAAKNSLFTPTLLSGSPVKLTGVIHYNFIAK